MSARGAGDPRSRRRLPVQLCAVVAAYLAMLCGSPIGQASYLWIHLATAHQGLTRSVPPAQDGHEAARQEASSPQLAARDRKSALAQHRVKPEQTRLEREKRHVEQHQHHEHHEHDFVDAHDPGAATAADAAPQADAGDASPAPPHAAHEHNGVVHTHEGNTRQDLALSGDELSKYFLAPLISPGTPPVSGGFTAPASPAAPEPAPIPTETPPPRTLA